MKRLERLHALSERLRQASPATISTTDLAAEFEVSRRTMERDLDALRRAGATLWGQPGRTGGVGIVDGPRRLVSLTDAEIAGLVVAVHAVGQAPFATHARRAVGSLIEHAGPEAKASIESVRSRILLAETDADPAPARIRHTIEDAIVQGRQLSLSYEDRNGAVTRRRVDPAGFLGNGTTWSLAGFCHLRNDDRLFRLQRIRKATMTANPIEARPVKDVLGEVPFETRHPE